MRPLVYIDVETSGLDPERHEIWEIAYAVDGGEIQSSFVRHQRITLDWDTIAAARVNHYVDRCPPGFAGVTRPAHLRYDDGEADYAGVDFERDLIEALEDATLVGANPAFDAAMLRARWGFAPWHYRLLDIEAYAAGFLGWSEMRGLAGVAEALGVAAPDHTAAGDVHCVRECWRAMRARHEASAWRADLAAGAE